VLDGDRGGEEGVEVQRRDDELQQLVDGGRGFAPPTGAAEHLAQLREALDQGGGGPTAGIGTDTADGRAQYQHPDRSGQALGDHRGVPLEVVA